MENSYRYGNCTTLYSISGNTTPPENGQINLKGWDADEGIWKPLLVNWIRSQLWNTRHITRRWDAGKGIEPRGKQNKEFRSLSGEEMDTTHCVSVRSPPDGSGIGSLYIGFGQSWRAFLQDGGDKNQCRHDCPQSLLPPPRTTFE